MSSSELPSHAGPLPRARQLVHTPPHPPFPPTHSCFALVRSFVRQVFSKTYCPFCVKAKRALETVLPREKISVMELESRPDCADIQDYLMSITGGRSVPRVFVAGKFIGGGDDTEALARSGKLKEMLEQNDII